MQHCIALIIASWWLVAVRNMTVVWLALPPLLNSQTEETSKSDKYAWEQFAKRNNEAFQVEIVFCLR
jgi:hypothetical protein